MHTQMATVGIFHLIQSSSLNHRYLDEKLQHDSVCYKYQQIETESIKFYIANTVGTVFHVY